jgi:heme exporter protein C
MVFGFAIDSALGGLILGYVSAVGLTARRTEAPAGWEHPLGVVGVVMLAAGCALALWVAPPERFMSDVGRILYVHVPAAWLALLTLCAAAVSGFASLMTGRRGWDALVEATSEVGVVHAVLLMLLGALFARPTWGTWWSWDPRLTTTLILAMSFVGLLLLRSIVRDPERRATWSAIVAILAGVNVPVVYKSAEWASIHAKPTVTPAGVAMASEMQWILYFVTAAFLYVTVWGVTVRWRIAMARLAAEDPEPLAAA